MLLGYLFDWEDSFKEPEWSMSGIKDAVDDDEVDLTLRI